MSSKKIKLDIKYLQDYNVLKVLYYGGLRMVLSKNSSYCMLDKIQRQIIIDLLETSRSNKSTKKLELRLRNRANYLNQNDIKLIYSLKRDYRKSMIFNAKKVYRNYEISILLIVCLSILVFSQYLDNYI